MRGGDGGVVQLQRLQPGHLRHRLVCPHDGANRVLLCPLFHLLTHRTLHHHRVSPMQCAQTDADPTKAAWSTPNSINYDFAVLLATQPQVPYGTQPSTAGLDCSDIYRQTGLTMLVCGLPFSPRPLPVLSPSSPRPLPFLSPSSPRPPTVGLPISTRLTAGRKVLHHVHGNSPAVPGVLQGAGGHRIHSAHEPRYQRVCLCFVCRVVHTFTFRPRH